MKDMFRQLVGWATKKSEEILVEEEIGRYSPSPASTSGTIAASRSPGTQTVSTVPSRPVSQPVSQPTQAPSPFLNLPRASTNSIMPFDSILNEYLQRNGLTASFVDVRSGGTDHMPLFRSDCMMSGEVVGSGMGSNKREAKKEACRVTLEVLGVNV